MLIGQLDQRVYKHRGLVLDSLCILHLEIVLVGTLELAEVLHFLVDFVHAPLILHVEPQCDIKQLLSLLARITKVIRVIA